MSFGDTTDVRDIPALIDSAAELGIFHLDTANIYCAGECERLLGSILRSRLDCFTLATKIGMPYEDAAGCRPLSAVAVRQSVEGCLRRLRTDHIDLLYLHRPDPSTDVSETVEAVSRLLSSGMVRAWGLANFSTREIFALHITAGELGVPFPMNSQQLYNVLACGFDSDYVKLATAGGLDTTIYNPLCGGLLTGLYAYDAVPASGRYGHSRLSQIYRQRYWHKAVFDAIEQLKWIAGDCGTSLRDLALRWLLSKPVVDRVLLGASTAAQLRSNAEAVRRGRLPDDVVAACDRIGAWLSGQIQLPGIQLQQLDKNRMK